MTTMNHEELFALEHIGYTLIQHDKLSDAQKLFAGLSLLSNASWYSHYALGLIAKKQRNYPQAIAHLQHAQKLHHQLPSHEKNYQPDLALAKLFILTNNLANSRQTLSSIIQHTSSDHAANSTARALLKAVQK